MSDIDLYEDTHGDGCGCPADQTLGIDGTPAWAYDEDGYCVCCGNGRWKHHMPDCELRDALDMAVDSVSAVRAGVESGTIKGEVMGPLRMEAFARKAPSGFYIVAGPVSDGGEDRP